MVTATTDKPAKIGTALTVRFRVVRTLTLVLPMVILGILIITAILAPLLAPYDPIKVNLLERRLAPSWMGGSADHFLGTDNLGRDILSRAIFGARISLT